MGRSSGRRGQNLAERKRVSQMNAEETKHALLISERVDRRAFDGAEDKGAVAMSDADGVKAL